MVNNFKRAMNIINGGKEKVINKKGKLDKYKSIVELQLLVDNSEEKRELFINFVKNGTEEHTNKKILEQGIVVYVKYLDIIKVLEEDLRKNNILFNTITGATSVSKRGKIVDWFNLDSSNKVLIISDAGGESLNIKGSNHIVLYNIPSGWRAYLQTIGRVCRGYFDTSHVHLIQVENTIDTYLCDLISARKEIEHELLGADIVNLTEVTSFNAHVLRKVRKEKLWRST